PRSTAELTTYLERMYAGGTIVVGDVARRLADQVLSPPVPRPARPLLWLLRLPTVGLLPPAIRAGYGFTWGPRHEAALYRSAGLIRRLLPLTPPLLRYWPAARRRRGGQRRASGAD
ncbi:MAG TPA: oxygenase MpaB family protein, partial [Chloroflexota bacterium]|nr:oxygenase MpaB family protein [Chloroflexota bacterium]